MRMGVMGRCWCVWRGIVVGREYMDRLFLVSQLGFGNEDDGWSIIDKPD